MPATRRGGSARPVRVLIACDHIDHQGALHGGGRQLIELTRALHDSDRVEPTVVVLRPPTVLGERLLAEGLPVTFLGDHRFSPASLFKLVRLVRERRIEVLHLTDFSASTWGRLAGAATGTPSMVQVITHHSADQPRGYPLPVKLAFRALAPLTARAIAISHSVREFAESSMGFGEGKVDVLHYPLPSYSFSVPPVESVAALRAQLGIADDDPVIGAVTRFHRVKGIDNLVEAFAAVRQRIPSAWLLLVGQGPEEGALRLRAAELGVADRVVFAGFQREVETHVSLFTVSAVPSLEEGFGLVALESLRLGVPVVASRVGGLPEIVQDGVSGLLVPPADSTALAGALIRVLEDQSLRQKLAAATADAVAPFTLERYVDRLTRIYEELAKPAS